MVDATTKFFSDLEPHHPLLENASGSLRFEITEGDSIECWRVDVRQGDISVSHEAGDADCVVRGSKPLFEGLVAGRENTMAAVLRGGLSVDGDLELLAAFQRVFPSPPEPST